MTLNRLASFLFTASLLATAALADDCRRASASLSQYVNCKVSAMAAREAQLTDLSKQAEANSAAPNATTLTDHSTGPNFVASSLAFPGLASKSSVPNSTGYSVAFSSYAMYSLLQSRNPFDSVLYSGTSNWRRLSFNFDDSYPAQKSSTISQGSRTYGAKYLLLGSRDIGDPSNQARLAALNKQIGPAGGAYGVIYRQVLMYFLKYSPRNDLGPFADEMENPDFFRSVANRLSPDDERQIEVIIGNNIASQVALVKAIRQTVKDINHAHQLSAIFTSAISKGTSTNLYRFGLAYDSGPIAQLNSTTNLTYDFKNAQQAETKNRQVLRLVQQLQYVALMTNTLPKRNVLTLAGSGEGDWGSNGAPVYRGNASLTLSAMPGVDIPLSFTYTSLIPSTGKSDSKFQATITLDFSKIAEAVGH
jgi:hypothetical protein